MDQKPATPATATEPEEPRFDVTVRLPSTRRLEDVARLAEAAGIRPDRVEALVKALRNGPSAKIGAAVPRDRADKAREQFTKAGLQVEITPVLSLTSMMTGQLDLRVQCPACDQKVMLPENRQCPHCGVFVDKVTEDVVLRKKLREKEKLALDFRAARDKQSAEKAERESLEARLRGEIRKELAEEYGLTEAKASPLRKGVLIGGGVLLVAAALLVGRASSTGFDVEALAGNKPATPAKPKGRMDPQDLMDKIDAGAPMGGNTAAAAAAHGGPITGDPDIDDPLVQAAGGNRIGKQGGISIEQAVAAAQTLAKAHGYRGPGSAEAEAAAAGSSAGSAPAGAAPVGGTGGSVTPAAAPGGLMPPRVRTQIAMDMTKTLAEIGQWPRSREMLKALKAQPVVQSDPVQVSAAQWAELEVRGWALNGTPAGALRPAVDKLLADAQALPEPAHKAKALMQVAVVAAKSPLLAPEAARLFLTKSADAVKVADASQQAALLGEWTVAFGEVLLAETIARARAGQWSKAAASGPQLQALLEQTPDPRAKARLHAIDYQLKSLTAADKAQPALAAALSVAQKENGLADRAALLRAIAALAGAAKDAQLAAAIEQTKTAALARSGAERARALTLLALIYADAGDTARAGELTQLALDTPGLSLPEAAELHGELLLRGDLATARALHLQARYPESEAVLRRLGQLLL